MPFTFAHPLYSFPIKWLKPRYFSLTGLILGSMSPDFEYFIALEPYQTIGHTHRGLFLQAIPLCIIILFVLHVIRKPLLTHLPSVFQLDRKAYHLIGYFDFRSWRSWIVFLLSVVIGFYSHLFVDSFTHASGYFVTQYLVLKNIYFSLPLYKLLQYTLSLVGLVVQGLLIIWLLYKSPYSTKTFKRIDSKSKLKYWLFVLILAITVIMAKLIFTSSSNVLGIVIVSSISGFLIGVVIASLFFRNSRSD